MIDVLKRNKRLYIEKMVFMMIMLKREFEVEWKNQEQNNEDLRDEF